MNLQSKIDYSIALLRKCEQMALDYDPDNGFYLAFSGGKDSRPLPSCGNGRSKIQGSHEPYEH